MTVTVGHALLIDLARQLALRAEGGDEIGQFQHYPRVKKGEGGGDDVIFRDNALCDKVLEALPHEEIRNGLGGTHETLLELAKWHMRRSPTPGYRDSGVSDR